MVLTPHVLLQSPLWLVLLSYVQLQFPLPGLGGTAVCGIEVSIQSRSRLW